MFKGTEKFPQGIDTISTLDSILKSSDQYMVWPVNHPRGTWIDPLPVYRVNFDLGFGGH